MDKYHEVSKRLYALLDRVGASEDMRRAYWDYSMIIEITRTVTRCDESMYYFGSSCEGTTTFDRRRDTDMLICHELVPVLVHVNDANERLLYYLMVNDHNTKPGYVQLQMVVDGIPQYTHSLRPAYPGIEESDDYGRICLMRNYLTRGTTQKGPAYTFVNDIDSIDYVYALRCRKVPHFADSLIHRTRRYDWPSQKQLEKMQSYGCFLVSAAHPHSYSKSIDWRISFSLQERELMSGLNPTQHKCYILLKMIKKDLIESETGESISSYHCKTCLFYTIETSRSSLWTPENLILCTRMCLVRLLNWSKNGNCPNYFIPKENMFDKLEKQTLENVCDRLECIVSSGIKFLFLLKSERIGARLINNLEYRMQINWEKKYKYKFIMSVVNSNYDARKYFLKNLPTETNKSLFKIRRRLKQMQETHPVTEHTAEEVCRALSYFIPYVHLQLAQSLVSVKLIHRGTNTSDRLPLDIIMNIIESSPSSRVSARLLLAAFYLQFGILEACERLLLTVELSLKSNLRSVCRCYFDPNIKNDFPGERIVNECSKVTDKEFVEQFTTGCLVFLQSQANIVHPALQYEMYRSVYTAAGSRIADDCWLDFTVVDPKTYLYFLQYIVCTKTNKPEHISSVVETFRHIIKVEKFIYHRETAYNLLGWMLIQEHRAIEAWQCFCRSWRIRPIHNAAKWHIVLLLNDILR